MSSICKFDVINQNITTMKIEKNFTTGVLSGICGVLVLVVIMGSSAKQPNKNYGLVPLNDDGSISISINNDQLNQLTKIIQEPRQIQQVQIVGYDKSETLNRVKVTKRGKLDVNP